MALIFFCVEITYIIITKTAKTRTTFYVVIKSVTSYLFQLKRTYTNITVFKCMFYCYVIVIQYVQWCIPETLLSKGEGAQTGRGDKAWRVQHDKHGKLQYLFYNGIAGVEIYAIPML